MKKLTRVEMKRALRGKGFKEPVGGWANDTLVRLYNKHCGKAELRWRGKDIG